VPLPLRGQEAAAFDQLGENEAMAVAEGTTIAAAMYCHP
jgi:hypothetical protein